MKRTIFYFFLVKLFFFAAYGKESRIIGGAVARVGQFPFVAAINVQTATSKFFCGGALVASQWIVTAGHCVYNAELFTIQLGSNQLESDDPLRVTVATSTYFLHPDFDPDTIQNDIGLIKLRIAIENHDYLYPVYPLASKIEDYREVYIQGWGDTSDYNSSLSNELNYVEVTTIPNAECRVVYGNQITDNMVCVIGNYNEGTCHGDNGGGLVVPYARGYGLVGVASFVSSDGCESTHPSGFTRIEPYYDWIVNTSNYEIK